MGCAECSKMEPSQINAAMEAQPLRPKKKLKLKSVFTRDELLEAFENVDRDSSGELDLQEVAALLEELGIKYTASKLKRLFEAMDEDEDGVVNQEEFINFFTLKDKSKGIDKILSDALKKIAKQEAKEQQEAEEERKAGDVLILHGMSDEAGMRLSWWLANVLEFCDIPCTGPYIARREGNVSEVLNVAVDSNFKLMVEQCSCVCLLLDGEYAGAAGLYSAMACGVLQEAAQHGLRICVFYNAEKDVWQKLAAWRTLCPFAFQRPAVPISMRFLSDSEQLVLNAVFDMLDQEAPVLTIIRPPGGDIGDFEVLDFAAIKWLKAEYLMALQPATSFRYMPLEACSAPGTLRPFYISYAPEDPSRPGLSQHQRQVLLHTLERNFTEHDLARVFFLDQVSIASGNVLSDMSNLEQLVEVISSSRFIILDEVAHGAATYLSHGKCFMEATIAILSGCITPSYDGQFVEIDKALGAAFRPGCNMRRFFRESASSPAELVDAICAELRRRSFASKEDAQRAEEVLRAVLDFHPRMVPGPDKVVSRRGTCRGFAPPAFDANKAMGIHEPIKGASGKENRKLNV